MSEKKSPSVITGAPEPEIETRALTVTITARVTRKQADAIVRSCEVVAQEVSKRLGVDLDVSASAPESTAKGSPDPDAGPCGCFKCSLLRAMGVDLDAQGNVGSGPRPPSSVRADESPSEPEPVINSIPARGPWGAS